MSRNTKELEDYVLLIGNPGVGKSTLINGLLGEAVFKSGISKLEGLTQFFQQKRGSDGVIYADTPGLADAVLRERAGEEITKALQQNGVYKIFFVVNLMSGRVMTSDLATVDAVMNAIKIPNVTYSIIVNKLTRGEQRKGLANNHEEYSHYFQLKNFKAPKIFFFNHDDILDGSDNAIFDESDNSKALKSFISSAPRITIQATQVDTITLKDYEEKILGLENLLQKKTAEFQALFDQQKKAFKEQIRIEKEEAEKAKKVEIEKKKREEAERIKLLQEKTAEFQALFDQQKKAFKEQIRIEKEEAEKAKKVEIEKKKREEAKRIKLLQEKTAEFQALDQQNKAFKEQVRIAKEEAEKAKKEVEIEKEKNLILQNQPRYPSPPQSPQHNFYYEEQPIRGGGSGRCNGWNDSQDSRCTHPAKYANGKCGYHKNQ